MILANANIEEIRSRMGADATTEEAHRMVKLLAAAGVTDTDDISEVKWFELVAIAADSGLPVSSITAQSIGRSASDIAGALWDDRDKVGTLSEQLTAVASEPSHGTDGDLTSTDRAALLKLAATAKDRGL